MSQPSSSGHAMSPPNHDAMHDDPMHEHHGSLRGYDLETSTLWQSSISPATQVLVDLAVCPNGMIAVADQTTAANGLRVYDGVTEKTSAPLPIGLRPGSSHGLVCY